MVPLRLFPEMDATEKVRLSTLQEPQRDLLNRLRIAALGCRAAARADLFEACAVLSVSDTVSKTAYIDTLMRCLPQALGKAPVFYRPCVEEISFDEAWLLRAVDAAGRDPHSFEFLIRSRVPHAARRNLGYLLGAVFRQFCQP